MKPAVLIPDWPAPKTVCAVSTVLRCPGGTLAGLFRFCVQLRECGGLGIRTVRAGSGPAAGGPVCR